MTGPQRYTVPGPVKAHERGQFIRYSAHVRIVKTLRASIEDLGKRLDFAATGLGVVERRRDRLKAENEVLRNEIERLRAALILIAEGSSFNEIEEAMKGDSSEALSMLARKAEDDMRIARCALEPEGSQNPALILPDDAPELTDEAINRATFKVGGKVVSREEWQAAAKAYLINGE